MVVVVAVVGYGVLSDPEEEPEDPDPEDAPDDVTDDAPDDVPELPELPPDDPGLPELPETSELPDDPEKPGPSQSPMVSSSSLVCAPEIQVPCGPPETSALLHPHSVWPMSINHVRLQSLPHLKELHGSPASG